MENESQLEFFYRPLPLLSWLVLLGIVGAAIVAFLFVVLWFKNARKS